ncbi:hypothetical protein MseVgp145 [Melanoplus sanguinipes entomopoxvirus]|uniref:Uncharacterized protein n=1 Tax=Melanoplus sanguinipes entomopoxvirus TaxID=83191 RepID=Q9YVU7_MSEPV|nr:hypothetical protein MseVgp145 [Melanoplus sanguinipes entomopoxvirus]AAC97788.1 ORF MSV145 hypothetical protein [Melanoplus sanguinipes entomopoxvirus 'O']
MENEFNKITKSSLLYTPIMNNLIEKYGIDKIFNNVCITNNSYFYILLIEMQNYDIYDKISKNYKLIIHNLLRQIMNSTDLKEYINNIINIDNYKNLSDYIINKFWDKVYNVPPSNINIDNIKNINVSSLLSKVVTYKYYDPNKVTEFLIFTYYSKKDLAISILTNDDAEIDITFDNLLEIINNDRSIFSYINTNYYPLFKSSLKTIEYKFKVSDSNLDPGYLWKSRESFENLKNDGYAKNFNDVFFSILYSYIRNGFVTHNIIIWTYLFGYKILRQDLLKELFAIIKNIPIELSGIISDLLINKNYIAIDEILNHDEPKITYEIGQINVTSENVYNNYINVIESIAKKPFEPKGYFYNFDVDINKLKFNKKFFNFLFYNNPISKDILDLNMKIELNYKNNECGLDYIDKYIKLYNTYNLINNNVSDFNVLYNYEYVKFDFNNMYDIIEDLFELSIIKSSILKILFEEYSFIPKNITNLRKQYMEHIKRKSNLNNLYEALTSKSYKKITDKIICSDIYLQSIFMNF